MSLSKYNSTTKELEIIAGAFGMTGFQPRELATAITIDGTTYSNVEPSITALSGTVGKITDAQWAQVQTILS